MHPECAAAGAAAVATLIGKGIIRAADLATTGQAVGKAMGDLQREHGTDQPPARRPSRSQRRAERDTREGIARDQMRAQGLPLTGEDHRDG